MMPYVHPWLNQNQKLKTINLEAPTPASHIAGQWHFAQKQYAQVYCVFLSFLVMEFARKNQQLESQSP